MSYELLNFDTHHLEMQATTSLAVPINISSTKGEVLSEENDSFF